MGKPVAGEIVVMPFPQSNLQPGKRQPALVLLDLPGDDLILCQITSKFRPDAYSISIDAGDFERGSLSVDSYARASRLFTADQSLIFYSAAKVTAAKLQEIKSRVRELFR